jgi:GH15 family glucan-1,4-alpha-glucosidase
MATAGFRSCTGWAALTEQELPHLTGYERSAPVRIGNGAFTQRQNDVYGSVLDSVYLHTKMGGHIPPAPVAGA